jgi:hypothetical protein
MSIKRRIRRLAARKETPSKQNPILQRYLSLISISIGAFIGLVAWFIFFRCESKHCLNNFNPTPYMGLFGINAWIIGNYFFRK